MRDAPAAIVKRPFEPYNRWNTDAGVDYFLTESCSRIRRA